MSTTSDFPPDVEQEFDETARRFLNYRRQRDEMAKLMDKEKKPLNDILEQYGEVDPNGHRTLPVDPPVHGIDALVRQRKVQNLVDETKAEAIARAMGIYDRLFKPVMTLDEDAVMVALEEGLLTQDQVDAMYPQKVTHALMPRKAK